MVTQLLSLVALLRASADDPRPDDQLLAAFVDAQDEQAFAQLVGRHAGVVWGICRRTLGHTQDAEDAFQATVLVLALRGRRVLGHPSIGRWLYGVAVRVANKARVMVAKRQDRERRAARSEREFPPPTEPDLTAVLDEELDRLGEQERLPIVLCDVQGLSRAAAAARLGWTEGCLSGRLHRARQRLADRLRARGVAPAVAITTFALGGTVAPSHLVAASVAAAVTVSIHGFPPVGVSATIADLARAVLREMTMRTLKKVLLTAVLTGVLSVGLFGGLGSGAGTVTAAPVPVAKEKESTEVTPAMAELLKHRKVLKELKCTPEQRVAIEDHFDEQGGETNPLADLVDAVRRAVPPGGGVNPNALPQQIEKAVQDKKDVVAATTVGVAGKVLKPTQVARLAQIELQNRGAEAFTDPKVEETLKLTDDQKKVVREEVSKAKGDPGNGVGKGIAAALGLGDGTDVAAKRKAYEAIEGGLTKVQRDEWRKLAGEAVGFDLFALGQGGLGGGVINGGVQVIPVGPGGAIPGLPGVIPGIPPQPPKKEKDD